MSVRIRRATEDDVDTLVSYNCALAFETEDIELDAAVVRRGVERLLRAKSLGHYYVAERDSVIVGQTMITYEWSDWRCGLFWWIQSVYVSPAARRTGVYRALYAHVRALGQGDPDVCGIRLYVHHDNVSARETYRALGMDSGRYELFETEF